MMQIHILDAQNRLQPFKSLIRDSAKRAIEQISTRLSPVLDICFSDSPDHCNPELGIGGGAFSPRLLHVFLDPTNDKIVSSIDKELLAVLAHEVHHCVRMEQIADSTLADRLVTEGLACHFEVEMTGNASPSFLPVETLQSWDKHFTKMRPIMHGEDFCEGTMFLGKRPGEFPKYAGYAVGFGLVGKYLSSEEVSAAECVTLPTSRFIGR